MRIAMIGQKGMPAKFGGVERHVHDLAVRLASRGHEVTVYNRAWYSGHTETHMDGVHIVTIPTLKTKHLDTPVHTVLSTLAAMRSGVDVMHYHGVGPALFSWVPRIFAPKIHVVTTFHSIDRKHEKWGLVARLVLRLGEWAACRFAHKTIAVSDTITQYARDVYDADAVYIPNAVEVNTPAETTETLSAFGLTSGKYILVISRLIPHKGIHYAIDAWKQLQRDKPDHVADLKLAIVGDGHYTDTYVQALKAQAAGDSRIVFTGFQSGQPLKELYSHAALMVHPSDNEGLPMVVLEGMSYGLPVLLSDIIEHKSLATDAAYLFQAGNTASLVAQLTALLEKNEEERWLHGQSNRSMVIREYTWETLMPRIEQVYERGTAPQRVASVEAVSA